MNHYFTERFCMPVTALRAENRDVTATPRSLWRLTLGNKNRREVLCLTEGTPSRLNLERSGAGWRARLLGLCWAGSCSSGSRSADRSAAPVTDPGRLKRQMIPPDRLACGVPLSLPDASRCSRVRRHTPVDCLGPAALSPAGLQGAMPLPRLLHAAGQNSSRASKEKSPQQKQKQQKPPKFFLATSPTSLCGSGADSLLMAEEVREAQPGGQLRHCAARGRFPRYRAGCWSGFREVFSLRSGAANRGCGASSPSPRL